MKKPIRPCPQCDRTTAGDCSRGQCARRKPVTAQVPDDAVGLFQALGTYRRPPSKRGQS